LGLHTAPHRAEAYTLSLHDALPIDPRPVMLRDIAQSLGGSRVDFAVQVEETVERVLAELKPGRELHTNVEYYAGVVMEQCGIPRELVTSTFAATRVVAARALPLGAA